jgi:hypothetical protein
MHGHMNVQSQNYSNWCSENPFAIHESPDINESETGENVSAPSMISYGCFEEMYRWVRLILGKYLDKINRKAKSISLLHGWKMSRRRQHISLRQS